MIGKILTNYNNLEDQRSIKQINGIKHCYKITFYKRIYFVLQYTKQKLINE